MRQRKTGFTLIELMITVAVVGILAAIAYPSYMDSVRKSRRSEAMNALSAIALAQEKWRANNTSYSDLSACASPSNGCWVVNGGAAGSGIKTEGGYYELSSSGITNTTFTITAAAAGSQANDTACLSLIINQNGPDTSTTAKAACWKRN